MATTTRRRGRRRWCRAARGVRRCGTGGGAGAGAARGAAAGGAAAAGGGRALFTPNPAATLGHQVFKFSPTGQLLMTIGKPGGAIGEECCYQPNDVITNAAGDIFIAEGHDTATGRIRKFSKDGKLLKTFGSPGTGPGQLSCPHALRSTRADVFSSQTAATIGCRSSIRMGTSSRTGTQFSPSADCSSIAATTSTRSIPSRTTLPIPDGRPVSDRQDHRGSCAGVHSGHVNGQSCWRRRQASR